MAHSAHTDRARPPVDTIEQLCGDCAKFDSPHLAVHLDRSWLRSRDLVFAHGGAQD